MTPDELPVGAATPGVTPEPAAAPAKAGRKPAVPKPPDTRPLSERVKEAFDRLRAEDGVIRAEDRKLEACQATRRDAQNRIDVCRKSIMARERWLEKEAVAIIQKQTGIRTIPGFSPPKPLGAWLMAKKEARERVKSAAQAVRLQLSPPT